MVLATAEAVDVHRFRLYIKADVSGSLLHTKLRGIPLDCGVHMHLPNRRSRAVGRSLE